MRAWARIRTAWRVLRHSRQLDASMHEEMRFHIEMEAERLVRELGVDLPEARRQAHVRFGGVEQYKEEARDGRGRQWLDAVVLDARLAVRMLVKHRGLTLAGGFAMAIAIAVGAASFEAIGEVLNPALPIDEGARVVSIQCLTPATGRPEPRVLRDLVTWRVQLTTLQHLSAFRTVQHNLATGTAPPDPVKVAEMTASGFAVARTAPLLGRYLLPSDEREGAPRVVVIGHEAWQSRFGGDPQILSRTIALGGSPRAVIGVMPRGFKFPLDHQFWIPIVTDPVKHDRLQGPELYVFGRLAPGVTRERAQAELTAVLGSDPRTVRGSDPKGEAAAHRPANEHTGTVRGSDPEAEAAGLRPAQARLRFVVLPYTHEHLELTDPNRLWALRVLQLLIGALSFVVSVNLAVLIYARTVTRFGEIAVRSALGASRRRILAQLFVEALALSAVGATAGLLLAKLALGRIAALVVANGTAPFWLDFELSPATVLYAAVLAALAAVIMGVLPGLKATGSDVNTSLRELHSRTGTNLGSVWTSLVIGQVAVAVAVLPIAVYVTWQVVKMEAAGPGFTAASFVVGTAVFGDDVAGDSTRVRNRQLELVSRLEAEPGVSAVTFSSSVPGLAGDRRIEFDSGAPVQDTGPRDVSTLDVALDLFDTYGARILAGRAFTANDVGAARSVIVNRSFVRELLDNRDALGQRFRYSRSSPSYQIVGVVDDFPAFPPAPGSDGAPVVYHPAAPGDIHPIALTVRFNGGAPENIVERLREIGQAIDPGLQLRRVMPLSEFYGQLRSFWHHLAWGIGLVTMSVLLLSAAGIYALMSFTVARRTREIGIRAALGAPPRGLLLSIFGRALRQLALGLLAGSLLSGTLFMTAGFGVRRAAALLAAVAALMLIVGLFATLGPARRSLRMHAMEALRTG